MSKKAAKKPLFRKVHLQAILLLLLYTVLSKFIFVKSITSESYAVNFMGPYMYGVVAGSIFLYLFGHEDFFHFIRDVERQQKKKEDKYIKKYIHYGKVFCSLIVATVGGPVFSALTVRLLLNRAWFKYLLIAIGNIPSTLVAVAMGKGALFVVLS
jgi:hypothetical protein